MSLDFAVVSAGISHVGLVRSVNEDSWLARPDLGLWVVADGMGGHRRGDLASRTLTDSLGRLSVPTDARDLRAGVEAAIARANAALRRMGGDEVIGSTIALLLLHSRHFAALWAGDSRIYRHRGGALELLSHDHSLVQELVDRGEIDGEQVEHHPWRNIVSRAVGVAEELVLDAVQGELQSGDLFLLCSDGLTKHLSDTDIAARLGTGDVQSQLRDLLEATLARGAEDNVTAVAIALSASDELCTVPGFLVANQEPQDPNAGEAEA